MLLSTQSEELVQNDHPLPEEQVTQQQKRGFIVTFSQVCTSLDLETLLCYFSSLRPIEGKTYLTLAKMTQIQRCTRLIGRYNTHLSPA
jgi:hypothetical protein